MKVDIKKLYYYWARESSHSWEIAEALWEKKKYPECLFFAHLTIEKILKALVVAKTKEHAPPIHNLAQLAKLAELNLTSAQKNYLKEWNKFYLVGRYDEEKMDFRKNCTKIYTAEHFHKILELYLWLKEQTKKYQPR